MGHPPCLQYRSWVPLNSWRSLKDLRVSPLQVHDTIVSFVKRICTSWCKSCMQINYRQIHVIHWSFSCSTRFFICSDRIGSIVFSSRLPLPVKIRLSVFWVFSSIKYLLMYFFLYELLQWIMCITYLYLYAYICLSLIAPIKRTVSFLFCSFSSDLVTHIPGQIIPPFVWESGFSISFNSSGIRLLYVHIYLCLWPNGFSQANISFFLRDCFSFLY